MKTEVPLSRVLFQLSWPPGSLICVNDDPTVLFTNGLYDANLDAKSGKLFFRGS